MKYIIKSFKTIKVIILLICSLYLMNFLFHKIFYKSISVNSKKMPLKSNVYINIDYIDDKSAVFTFFNSNSEYLVYTYKIEVIDAEDVSIIKEYKVHTALYLKENSLSNVILKVDNLKSQKNYIIKISAEEYVNGFKISPINITFKTL